jgi:rhamnosyltransferase
VAAIVVFVCEFRFGGCVMSRVAVLMSTYNGEKYLRDQVESIIAQRGVEVELFIRDDGSTDGTRALLDKIALGDNRIHVFLGENVFYPKSFLSLCKTAIGFDYYAFSDQDDHWKTHKLISAIEQIQDCESVYSLYASSLSVVDKDLKVLGTKDFPGLTTSLGSEISRHRLAGCTMVWPNSLHCEFNKYLDPILQNSPIPNAESHDGWITLFCILRNGTIIYDSEPLILFRRHDHALTNSGAGIKKRIAYEMQHFFNRDDYRRRLSRFLLDQFDFIDEDSRALLNNVCDYRNNGLSGRFELIASGKIRTGIPMVDLLNKAAILISVY